MRWPFSSRPKTIAIDPAERRRIAFEAQNRLLDRALAKRREGRPERQAAATACEAAKVHAQFELDPLVGAGR